VDISETLEYIHNVKWQNVKPGLERIRTLLSALGNPEKSLKFVHVAGTNGKGSTSACIASVLQEAGYRTGLFISPYILRFNERMQVNGEHIPDGELIALTGRIRPFADSMADPPTEFEMITALAMQFFLDRQCDIVVLEVGMGGELDSTNIIETPELAVITAIGLDHVKELGPELTDIAKAKAGIIKRNGSVLIYGGEPEVEDVFTGTCAAQGAKLHKADFGRIKSIEYSLNGTKFSPEPYGTVELPLIGAYQPKNALVAVTAAELLREKGYIISDNDIIKGISSVKWPGRFEILGREPVFILDGAHNPQGIEAAAESIRRHFGGRKVVFLFGVSADKDIGTMIPFIAPLAESFIAIKPDNPRSMDAGKLAALLSSTGVPVSAPGTVSEGVARALETAGRDGIVCALGSLFISAPVREAYAIHKSRQFA